MALYAKHHLLSLLPYTSVLWSRANFTRDDYLCFCAAIDFQSALMETIDSCWDVAFCLFWLPVLTRICYSYYRQIDLFERNWYINYFVIKYKLRLFVNRDNKNLRTFRSNIEWGKWFHFCIKKTIECPKLVEEFLSFYTTNFPSIKLQAYGRKKSSSKRENFLIWFFCDFVHNDSIVESNNWLIF